MDPKFIKGLQIAYIPSHAETIFDFDVEFGFMYKKSNDPTAVFCRYWRKGRLGELRTTANSELTNYSELTIVKSVPQSVVEEVIDFIEEET